MRTTGILTIMLAEEIDPCPALRAGLLLSLLAASCTWRGEHRWKIAPLMQHAYDLNIAAADAKKNSVWRNSGRSKHTDVST